MVQDDSHPYKTYHATKLTPLLSPQISSVWSMANRTVHEPGQSRLSTCRRRYGVFRPVTAPQCSAGNLRLRGRVFVARRQDFTMVVGHRLACSAAWRTRASDVVCVVAVLSFPRMRSS